MEKLRLQAEEILHLKNEEFSEKIDDVKKLMHDLQVYQIELELQNKELQEYSEKVKNAERKFYTIFNFAPIPYFLMDFKGIILDCNLCAIELLYHSKESINRKPIISYIAEGRKDEFYTFLDEISQSKEIIKEEFALFTKNRNIIEVEFSAIVIQSEFILAAAIDITEKKNKDRLLNQALLRSEQSDKLKTDFLNTISHEVRTPLNSIVGFTELISKENISNEKRINFAQIIKKSSFQLIQIIEDILIVSRISNQDIFKQRNKFLINNFLDELKSNFTYKYKNTSLEFDVIVPDYDLFIITDRQKLFNIFERLIDNAFKFTKEGKIEVACYKKNDSIMFYVKDTGCGISSEKQKNLFKPFNHFDKQDYFSGGLGLGLAIAKGYIDLLCGKIWFENSESGGAIFYITIPHEMDEENIHVLREKKEIKTNITNKTILIAEDEQINFDLFHEVLSRFDVTLLHALNGKIALDLYQQHNVDMIIMDLNMPEMNGVSATEIIRKNNTQIPIVALTAHTETQANPEVKKLFNAFIFKPIDISVTINILNELINE